MWNDMKRDAGLLWHTLAHWKFCFKRKLNELDLRFCRPSLFIKDGVEVDLAEGRFNVIRVQKGGTLCITGAFSCYRFELHGGRVFEFIQRGHFEAVIFDVREGSLRGME